MGKKEKTEVGTEVGKGVQKNPAQMWPYLCAIFLNTLPNQPPICDRYVYKKRFTILKEVGTSKVRVLTLGLTPKST